MEVTLTIKVQREEDFKVLRTLIDVLQHNQGERKGPHQEVSQPWTEEAFLRLWGSVTECAQDVMREIAKKPEGYPRDTLLAKLNISGAELGRCMSSIGHHMERTDSYRKYQRPIVRNWEGEVYMMPEDVAQFIRQLGL